MGFWKARRFFKINMARRGHCVHVVAVAGVSKGAVGQCEDQAAVANMVTIDHVSPNQHGHQGFARCDAHEFHAQRVGGAVARPHYLANRLGQCLRIKGLSVHVLALMVF